MSVPDALLLTSMTRLTWMELRVDGRKDTSWIEPLSQLPSLTDLEVTLWGPVPAGFGALTQCTRLELHEIDSTDNLSCLQHLTCLEECRLSISSAECLLALPDCLAKLTMNVHPKLLDQSFGRALEPLTALEDLAILPGCDPWAVDGNSIDWVCSLPALPNLKALDLVLACGRMLQLGPLPCLRSLKLENCRWLEETHALRQLGALPSLRSLTVYNRSNGIESDKALDLRPDELLDLLAALPLLEELRLPQEHWHQLERILPGGVESFARTSLPLCKIL